MNEIFLKLSEYERMSCCGSTRQRIINCYYQIYLSKHKILTEGKDPLEKVHDKNNCTKEKIEIILQKDDVAFLFASYYRFFN